MSSQPIGIFDSGLGGLTVFREIAALLPQESLIYLGDTARVPYGTKSARTVIRYAKQNVRFLLKKEVKAVVVACNTASAFSLEELKKEFPVPVVGVIEPGIRGALKATRSGRIGVIGTEGTISSGAYGRDIKGAACPLFVPLVEEGWWEHQITESVAKIYLSALLAEKIDALILGCTHYPLLKRTLSKVAGPGVALVDSAAETAKVIAEVLAERKIATSGHSHPHREFYVTDAPERFRRLGELFLGQKIESVEHVEIGA